MMLAIPQLYDYINKSGGLPVRIFYGHTCEKQSFMHWHHHQSNSVREYRSDHSDCRLQMTILEEGLVRVRYIIPDILDDQPTYGVSSAYQPLPCPFDEVETDDFWELLTGTLRIRIRKADLGVDFIRAATDLILSSDETGPDYAYNDWTGDNRVRIRKKIRESEYFYGLGDKPADLNLRRKRFEMWGADHYAFRENSDPLYKNITFFLSLFDGLSYGIFFDNTSRSYFDFGLQKEDVLAFGAEGGQMDYYFFHAESPLGVIASYTRLTGLPPLPPMWALGYHQSKWSYYPERIVRNVAESMRTHRIPCDALHLDIHHMDNYRSLTWDPAYFPDPAGLVSDLEAQGFKTVTIVNPGIKVDPDCPVWQSGHQHNCFCRRHDGALMDGVVWPGACHFPDFTNPSVRGWWKGILGNQLSKIGIRGIWNDMNEPVIFPDKTFPMDTRHDYDGRPCSHAKAHNIYGHCMASASRDAMIEHGGGNRPFNLSRSGYSGLQRFAATWTGDNCSTWEHLRMADFQCQRLAASGVSFAGTDAGGFLEHPTAELFCRWMQMAAFHGFFRNHSSGEYGGQEPWTFGNEVTGHIRFAIEQRYRLLPYLYTQFHRYATEGLPVLRSLALQCSETDDTYWRGVEFFLGDHLYVVPVIYAEARGTTLYVPDGAWYSLWTDEAVGPPCSDVWTEAPLARIPVYVRGGAVIPRWPVQQHVGEIECPDLSLDLWWAPDTICESSHYEDAGEGMSYQEGDFIDHRYRYESSRDCFELAHEREGEGSGFHGLTTLVLHALPDECALLAVVIDEGAETIVPRDGDVVSIPLPDDFSRVRVTLKRALSA